LLADIESGRMLEKLTGCSEDADVVILCIEKLLLPSKDGRVLAQDGKYTFKYYHPKNSPFAEGAELTMSFRTFKWRYKAVQNFLLSCKLRGTIVMWTLSPNDTAFVLKDLDDYFCKPEHPMHMSRSKPFSFSRDKNESLLQLVEGLHTVGRDNAKALLEHFGYPLKVFNASSKELMEVGGIGKVSSKAIHDMVREEYKE